MDTDRPAASLCPVCAELLRAGMCPCCGEEATTTAAGASLDRYVVGRRVATGGMGVVYEARDTKLKRTVALKMVRGARFADAAELARFTIEAEAAAALDHPNIVPIYEVGHVDEQPFFTMKLIDGCTLTEHVRAGGGTLPGREAARLLRDVARAVHHAHQRGVLHRDLKPGNILIDREGRPWLTDFGLAKLTHRETDLTLTSVPVGTPHYMAPEVAGGTARTFSTAGDVWALGVILWEMIGGMPPFHGTGPVEIMRRIVEEEPAWPSGTRADADLLTIARRCLEKQPHRRPADAGEVADELDRWLRGEPIHARPVTPRERAIKWLRRHPAAALLGTVLTVAAVSVWGLWLRAEAAVSSLTDANHLLGSTLRVATVSRLAGDARLQIGEDACRALLLAAEASAMAAGGPAQPEATSSLVSVLQQVGGVDASLFPTPPDLRDGFLPEWEHERRLLRISPDSRWLVHAALDDDSCLTLAAFDLRAPRSDRPAGRWRLPLRVTDWSRFDWQWLPDSRHAVIGHGDGSLSRCLVIDDAMLAGGEATTPPELVALGTAWTATEAGGRVWLAEPRAGAAGQAVRGLCLLRGGAVPTLRTLEVSREGLARVRDFPLPDVAMATAEIFPSRDLSQAVIGDHEGHAAPLHVAQLPDAPTCHRLPVPPFRCRDVVFAVTSPRFGVQLFNEQLWLADPAAGDAAAPPPCRLLPPVEGRTIHTAISPDGRWLARGGDSSFIAIDAADDPDRRIRRNVPGITRAVTFSADSRWLAAGGTARSISVWAVDDPETAPEALVFHGLAAAVRGIAFSPDGTAIAANACPGIARRWTFNGRAGGSLPHLLPAGRFDVRQIAASPDGRWIAAACRSRSLDTSEGYITLASTDGRLAADITAHGPCAMDAAFSRDGRGLATSGRDGNVNVWNFPALAAALAADQPPPEPDFAFIVENIRRHFDWRLAFHPDNRLYAATGDGVVLTWDMNARDPGSTFTGERLHSIGYLLPAIAISPDGRTMALARHGWDAPAPDSPQHGNQVLLYDLADSWPPRFRTALPAGFLAETNLAFSPNGRWLASGAAGGGASVWDLAAADIAASRRTAPTAGHQTCALAFSPDSSLLALGGSDAIIHLWNWRTGSDAATFAAGTPLHAAAWLPDGRLATAGGAPHVALWETDPRRLAALARTVAGRPLHPAECLRFHLPVPQR